jgi:hypothetical protein
MAVGINSTVRLFADDKIAFNRFQDVTMEFVLMFYRFDFSADGKYVAFLWVKHLFPLLLP